MEFIVAGGGGPVGGAEEGHDVGRRYVGVGLGSPEYRKKWVETKVREWVSDVKRITALGRTHPHSAYSILTRVIIPTWRFTMRTTQTDPECYLPLEDALLEHFFPDVLGLKPGRDSPLRRRCALPVRHSGLGIPRPQELAGEEREAAQELIAPLVEAILGQDAGYELDGRAIRAKRRLRQAGREVSYGRRCEEIVKGLSDKEARSVEEAKLGGASSWLSATPIDDLGLHLDALEFRDAVALHLGLDPPDPLPGCCPSCGAVNSVSHALHCNKGGLVMSRHRAVLRAWAGLFRRAGAVGVVEEPVLPALHVSAEPSRGTTTATEARADILVRQWGQAKRNLYLDVAVVDTFADCYIRKQPLQALENHEKKKEEKYHDRVSPHGTFVPLVNSVLGTMAPKAAKMAAALTRASAADPEDRLPVFELHATIIQAATLKAVSACLRARATRDGKRLDLENDDMGLRSLETAVALREDGLVAGPSLD